MKSKIFVGSAFAVLCGLALPPVCQVASAAENPAEQSSDREAVSMGNGDDLGSHRDAGVIVKRLAAAQYMIDGKMDATFTFDAADPNPTVVVDLGTSRSITKVSCALEAPAGQLDFYLVDNAFSKDGTQPVSLNYVTPPGVTPVANAETLNYSGDSVLTNHKPAGSVAMTGEAGVKHVSVNINGLQGRYLIAAFHRSGGKASGDYKDRDYKDHADYKDRDFKDKTAGVSDFKDFKDKNVAIADNPVKVAGISAFGEPPPSQTIPFVPPGGVVKQTPVSP